MRPFSRWRRALAPRARSAALLRPGVLALPLAVLLLAPACRFVFDNPAEKLEPGEVRGRLVRGKEGAAGQVEPVSDGRVRLRGSSFALAARPTGFFAVLDLPVGEHVVVFDAGRGESARSIERRVTIGLDARGQTEGVVLNDVQLYFTASLAGLVVDAQGEPIAGAAVVDEVSFASTVTGPDGRFVFPALAVGRHALRAAGTVLVGGKATSAVGGTVEVELTRADERGLRRLDPLALHVAERTGRVSFDVALMSPSKPRFSLEEVEAQAVPRGGGTPILLPPPNKSGRVEAELPEGGYSLVVRAPRKPEAAEFDKPISLSDLVILEGNPLHLGALVLASEASLQRARSACAVNDDCASGVCRNNRCEPSTGGGVDPCAVDGGGCAPEAQCLASVGAQSCECPGGYTGDGWTCQACPGGAAGPCSGRGVCAAVAAGTALCDCERGFTGAGCDRCEPGLYGESCALECPGGAASPCNGNGTCDDGTGGAGTCACATGWAGAACDQCAPGFLGPACDSLPPPPDAVLASDGAADGSVTVSWAPAESALRYRVYRDGFLVAEVEDTSFEDEGAEPGPPPEAPVGLAAGDTASDAVELSWEAAIIRAGTVHRYTVTAVNGSGEGLPGLEDAGHRAASPVTGYELSWDDGSTWLALGLALAHRDTDAPAPIYSGGVAVASQGTSAERVEVQLENYLGLSGDVRRYAVRAINAQGPGPASPPVEGWRRPADPAIAWEISAADSDADYQPSTGTGRQFFDEYAPADGEGRWYRAVVSVDGAPPMRSTPARGFRAVLPRLSTYLPDTLTASSAKLRAIIEEPGVPASLAYGFCVGPQSSPAHGEPGVVCNESAAAAGELMETRTGLLAATAYFVRSFARHPTLGIVYGGQAEFSTAPAIVAGVVASDGLFGDRVLVQWDPVPGATAYVVRRDGEIVGETASTSFVDEAAAPGTLSAPSNPQATQGTYPDRVWLTWEEVTASPGAAHNYSVTARAGYTDGEPSTSDPGHRGAPAVSGYEVSPDDGATWLLPSLSLSFTDSLAPAPTVEVGPATASAGALVDSVALVLSDAGSVPGATRTYRVRAVGDGGPGPASVSFTGFRGGASLSYAWEAAEAEQGPWLALPGATSSIFFDASAPADGTGRWYRCVVTAIGAAPAITTPVSGFRAVLPSVASVSAEEITGLSALLRGRIDHRGVPLASGYGFVVGATAAVELSDALRSVSFGPLLEPGPFSAELFDLEPGRTWFFRAYAVHPALGEVYAEAIEFLTLAAAPTGITASDGTDAAQVLVTWDAVPGATAYRVYRDGLALGDTAALEFADLTAALGAPPLVPPGFTASEDDASAVLLGWSPAPSGAAGPSHAYSVTALFGGGESALGVADEGFLAAPAAEGYEVSWDGGATWIPSAFELSHTDASAPAGSIVVGPAKASDGAFTTMVVLNLDEPVVLPGAVRDYLVRATSLAGPGEPAQASGRRVPGPVFVSWERSAGPSDADYAELPGVIGLSPADASAPLDGSVRYYRARVTAAGAPAVYSEADSGFVAVLPTITTLGLVPGSLTELSAVVGVRLDSEGIPPAGSVGLCWERAPVPLQGPDEGCDQVPSTGPGVYELPIAGLLPGVRYAVRGYAAQGVFPTAWGEPLEFVTLGGVEGLSASSFSPDRVTLTWNALPGAISYRVYRDGSFLSEVTLPSFEDEGAQAGSAPGEVADLQASLGTRTDGVLLTWSGTPGEAGPWHDYAVAPVRLGGEGAASAPVSGRRAAYGISVYEVKVDGTGDWVPTSLIPSHLDTNAPFATITAGNIAASKGTYPFEVALLLESVTVDIGAPRTYHVRARSYAGPGPSASATGRRAGGLPQLQWMRSAGTLDESYSDLPEATGFFHPDLTAPEDGSVRWYRCRVSAEGALDAYTPSDFGFRAVAPQVVTVGVLPGSLGETSFTAEGRLVALGLPQVTSWGICVGQTVSPGFEDDCLGWGGPPSLGPFLLSFEGLEPGTPYFFRAYAEHPSLGPIWGESVAVTTRLPPPPWVEATKGDYAFGVQLTWEAVPGATSYRVYRDGSYLTDSWDASFFDLDAAEPPPPAPPQAFTASAGLRTDGVLLTWSEPVPSTPVSHQYRVTAVFLSTESGLSPADSGHRGIGDFLGYEVSTDSGSTWTTVWDELWLDGEAPLAPVLPGGVAATAGTLEDRVALMVVDWSIEEVPSREYLVRQVRVGATGETASASGFRAVGPPEFSWERSAGEEPAYWTMLFVPPEAEVADYDAPADGSPRWYRAKVTAAGAEEGEGTWSAAGRGYRGVQPQIQLRPLSSFAGMLDATVDVVRAGAPRATDVGVCLSDSAASAQPGLAVWGCESFGSPGADGLEFTFRVVEPYGTVYARAYVLHPVYGLEWTPVEWLALVPEGVSDLTASRGDFADYVQLCWSAAEGADSYIVLRDGMVIEWNATSTCVVDTDAIPGSVDPPTAVEATSTRIDGVLLTWSPAQGTAGLEHDYYVIPQNAQGQGPASPTAAGHRGPPSILGYEVDVAGRGLWTSLGDVSEWFDTDAPLGTVEVGAATVSRGTSLEVVGSLDSAPVFTSPPPVQYAVRAVTASGAGVAEFAVGQRSLGVPAYWWYRSASDFPDNFDVLWGEESWEQFTDSTAPLDGSRRWYRMRAQAGYHLAFTGAVEGYRAVLPVVRTTSASATGTDSLSLLGKLDAVGVDPAAGMGFCLRTGVAGEEECRTHGGPYAVGPFSMGWSGLVAGVTYTVRAFATHPALGRVYGEPLEVAPLPNAPSGVSASDGSSLEYVLVSWSPVTGATGYAIYRDGALLTTVSAGTESYEDRSAGAGSVMGSPTAVTASTGAWFDRVEVTWDPPIYFDGAAHQYAVVAVNGSGEGPPSLSDYGYRSGEAALGYEVSIDGGGWIPVGAVTFFTDTSPALGTVVPGAASATKGVFLDRVRVNALEAWVQAPPAVTYSVRAIGPHGAGTYAYNWGNVGLGPSQYQWERADSPGVFTPIPTATSLVFDDFAAPANGTAVEYRCLIRADGAVEGYTAVDSGFRAVLPEFGSPSATRVDEASFLLSVDLTSAGWPLPTGHGFCVGVGTNYVLTHGNAEYGCVDLGPLSGSGTLDWVFVGEPGLAYRARPYVTHPTLGPRYGSTITGEFASAPLPPSAVSSSAYQTHVRVTWQPSPGATGYHVYRDGFPVAIGTVYPPATAFDDYGASPGGLPDAPYAYATSGTLRDRVEVSWLPVERGNGQVHEYTVVAFNIAGAGVPSAMAEGYRLGEEILGYEIDRTGSGTYQFLGSAFTYDDYEAPPAELRFGPISASKGTSTSAVTASLSGAYVEAAPERTYRVRAWTALGGGAPGSATGRRGAGDLRLQWQRSAGPFDADYAPVSGETATTFVDSGIPAGVQRWYRCVLSADGCATQITSPEWGYIAVAPEVETVSVIADGPGFLELTGEVISLGVEVPTSHGFCVSTTPNPSVYGADYGCVIYGPPASTGPFTSRWDSLPGGMTFHVRAFVEHPGLGYFYGANVSAITVPDAPGNLVASQGTFRESVKLTWDPVNGATTYRVYRDGLFLLDVSDTAAEDFAAAAGSPPPAPANLVASAGTYGDRVRLQWAAATAAQPGSHLYTVAAVNASGEGGRSAASSGHRAAPSTTGYEVSSDGGNSWTPVGKGTEWSDYGAPAGSVNDGSLTASQATSKWVVSLEVRDIVTAPGSPRSYRVRALNELGAGASSGATGYRGVEPLAYRWKRSKGQSAGDYEDVGGATTRIARDFTAPANGEPRWYVCEVTPPGGSPYLVGPASGARTGAAPVETPSAAHPTPMGTVDAVLVERDSVFLGGQFTHLGYPTGAFTFAGETSGYARPGPVLLEGVVHAVIAAGGAWYVGGDFTLAGPGGTWQHLVRLNDDGSLDESFEPAPDGPVYALRFAEGSLFVGGDFTWIGDAWRRNLAALDASGKAVASWKADADGTVFAIGHNYSRYELVIGGAFSTVETTSSPYLARVGVFNGVPGTMPTPNGWVRTIAVANGRVYFGGNFLQVAGSPRGGAAALDESTLQLLSWDPKASNVLAIAPYSSSVYLGGAFTFVNGSSRDYLALVDADTGNLQTWAPSADSWVHSLVVTSTRIFAGGRFSKINGVRRYGAASVSFQGSLDSWDPSTAGDVNALVVSAGAGTVALGGSFGLANVRERANLAEVQLTTGTITAWAPEANGRVRALAFGSQNADTVLVGGDFTRIGTFNRGGVAELSRSSGSLLGFAPTIQGTVSALAVGNEKIYVGGAFGLVDTYTRYNLAAFSRSSGELDTGYVPVIDGPVLALLPSGSSLFAAGSFSKVGGKVQSGLTKLSAAGEADGQFEFGFDAPVRVLAEWQGRLYLGGDFTLAGASPRYRFASIDLASGTLLGAGEANGPDGPVRGIALDEETLYVGGDYGGGAVGGKFSFGLAAMDGNDPAWRYPWNPALSRPRAVVVHNGHVIAGGDAGSLNLRSFAVFPPNSK